MWIAGILVLLAVLAALLSKGGFSTRWLWIAGAVVAAGVVAGIFMLRR